MYMHRFSSSLNAIQYVVTCITDMLHVSQTCYMYHRHVTCITDWTLSLTHYMQERAWRASSGNNYSGRPSVSSGTSGGGGGGPSEESLGEVHRWKYMVNLSSWLYQVNCRARFLPHFPIYFHLISQFISTHFQPRFSPHFPHHFPIHFHSFPASFLTSFPTSLPNSFPNKFPASFPNSFPPHFPPGESSGQT